MSVIMRLSFFVAKVTEFSVFVVKGIVHVGTVILITVGTVGGEFHFGPMKGLVVGVRLSRFATRAETLAATNTDQQHGYDKEQNGASTRNGCARVGQTISCLDQVVHR